MRFYDIDKLVCIRENLDRWSKCLLRVQAVRVSVLRYRLEIQMHRLICYQFRTSVVLYILLLHLQIGLLLSLQRT